MRFSEVADSRIRTDDLLITNQLLYQLSYAGELRLKGYKSYNVKTEGPESHRNFCNLQPFGRTCPIIRGRGSKRKGGPPFPNS